MVYIGHIPAGVPFNLSQLIYRMTGSKLYFLFLHAHVTSKPMRTRILARAQMSVLMRYHQEPPLPQTADN